MRARLLAGFSLMEMMVVLLIVAIIAAASAPMVSKKMSRGSSGESPWVFTGLGNNIAYNMSGDANSSAIIGSSRYTRRDGNSPTNPRLVIASGNDTNHPALAFADSTGTFSGQINMNAATGIVTMNDQSVGNNSVALGLGQTITGSPSGIVAIGQGIGINSSSSAVAIGLNSNVSGAYGIAIGNSSSYALGSNSTGAGRYSIAIGSSARASGERSIAIGAPDQIAGATPTQAGVNANAQDSVAIGTSTYVSGSRSVALGRGAWVNISTTNLSNTAVDNAVAIGYKATAMHGNSVAIGREAGTTEANQIVLGGPNDVVYIPGMLLVEGHAILSRESGARTWIRDWKNNQCNFDGDDYKGGDDNLRRMNGASVTWKGHTYTISDRRLKNVGKKYTSGLDELKKLDFFNYTFKKDESKTPRVGVMAQDLQKVFPDAVVKGDDGYLRIRLEDMFYAVINAVKELDQRYCKLEKTIESQQKIIEDLQKRIEKLEAEK